MSRLKYGRLRRRRKEHAWAYRRVAAAGHTKSRAPGTREYRDAEIRALGIFAAGSIRERSDALSRKRYDDRTLGNGGSVAGAGVPCLQERISQRFDRRV